MEGTIFHNIEDLWILAELDLAKSKQTVMNNEAGLLRRCIQDSYYWLAKSYILDSFGFCHLQLIVAVCQWRAVVNGVQVFFLSHQGILRISEPRAGELRRSSAPEYQH